MGINVGPYAKTIVAGIATVTAGAIAYFGDDRLTVEEMYYLLGAVLTVFGVYVVPNNPDSRNLNK